MNEPGRGTWTLLTGHGHVLVEITRNPEARIRDISPVVGLTERTVQAIVADLEADGYIARTRAGRRVVYTVNRHSLFRHSAQDGHRIGPFLDLLAATGTEATPQPQDDPEQARQPVMPVKDTTRASRRAKTEGRRPRIRR